MTAKPPIASTQFAAFASPVVSAEEYSTGYLPLTAEQQAWADANMVKVPRVLPNRLALKRVAAERQNVQGLVSATNAMVPATPAKVTGKSGVGNNGSSWDFHGNSTPMEETLVLDCTNLIASGTNPSGGDYFDRLILRRTLPRPTEY
jgi:hypothetical protein